MHYVLYEICVINSKIIIFIHLITSLSSPTLSDKLFKANLHLIGLLLVGGAAVPTELLNR